MKPVEVRPWREGDLALLADAAPQLSAHTLWQRFWIPVPTLPARYLRSIETRWPHHWDGVVALRDGRLVGWGEFGRTPTDPSSADVAACVVDAEQGQGIGTALLRAAVDLARAAGVTSVRADIHPANRAARRAWQSATGGVATTYPLAS